MSLWEAASPGGSLTPEAMERIAALYWKPVYCFVRVKYRKSNEDAKDLTQSFFASAIEREFFARFDPARASFRTYLRMAVERFAANEYAAANRLKRGGGVELEPVEEQAASAESPEETFEREWRRQLFTLALQDLRAECERAGKQTQWAVFEAYDLTDEERPSYAELAARHGVPETQITNYLAWARRTLRVLVREAAPVELSDSVLRHLCDVVERPDLSGTRYDLEGEIGRGGIGIVYAAHDRDLDRKVAIKVMEASLVDEAPLIARLEHPSIVPVFERGTLPDGRAWYAMKLVAGRRLDHYLENATHLGERLRVFHRVGEALAFAHSRGVPHRDLKPQNVMVGAFGEVYVMDWGVAGVAGTPAFRAPEARMDERGDIYGLGALLRFLTGGEGPPALRAVAAKAMSADPAARYQSVAALAGRRRTFPGRTRGGGMAGASLAPGAPLRCAQRRAVIAAGGVRGGKGSTLFCAAPLKKFKGISREAE